MGWSTPRPTRISYETLIIIFDKGKADIFIALTTASAAESPFVPDPIGGNEHYAPILDIGNQRKVAAALLDDYIIGTAMSRQLEAIKETVSM